MASKAKVRTTVQLNCGMEQRFDFYELCDVLSEELNEAEVKHLIHSLSDRVDMRELIKSMIDLV